MDKSEVMRRFGPQWSRMYVVPKTPEQHEENRAEVAAGIKRVREYVRTHNTDSEVEPDEHRNIRTVARMQARENLW